MKNKKKIILQLAIAIIGVFVTLFGLVKFNQYVLMDIPLYPRMIVMILTQWLLFLVPGILMIIAKEKISGLGLTFKHLGRQILIGIVLALLLSSFLTILPILLGFKDMVGSTNYTKAWQYAYQFAYSILGVAVAEELIFRGYIFHKLLELRNNRWFAIVISSLVFGLFHVFTGNLIQIFMTALLGFLFCLCLEKIKNCSLLSLIILHGVYDALIVLWVGIL
jgi:hypothetical protein